MLLFIRSCITALSFVLFFHISVQAAKVGIIVPLEHEAMKQIVLGITESLKDTGAEIEVKNAHGDANIMSSIVKQMRDDDELQIIMPIGTSTSQMTLAHIKNKVIVCVAAIIDNSKTPLVTGLNDEVPITASIEKLKALQKIAVIYSANEKITPEIEALKAYAKEHGISLHLSMIQNLTDLPSIAKAAPDDINSFLILKDHLVVSGINIITKEALKRQIPVIASDEGSVLNGATLAIGVAEKEIGAEAGLMARDIFNGKKPSEIPYKTLDKMVLFLNKIAFDKQKTLTHEMLKETRMEVVEK